MVQRLGVDQELSCRQRAAKLKAADTDHRRPIRARPPPAELMAPRTPEAPDEPPSRDAERNSRHQTQQTRPATPSTTEAAPPMHHRHRHQAEDQPQPPRSTSTGQKRSERNARLRRPMRRRGSIAKGKGREARLSLPRPRDWPRTGTGSIVQADTHAGDRHRRARGRQAHDRPPTCSGLGRGASRSAPTRATTRADFVADLPRHVRHAARRAEQRRAEHPRSTPAPRGTPATPASQKKAQAGRRSRSAGPRPIAGLARPMRRGTGRAWPTRSRSRWPPTISFACPGSSPTPPPEIERPREDAADTVTTQKTAPQGMRSLTWPISTAC